MAFFTSQPKTVDSILEQFNKTVTDLEEVAKGQDALRSDLEQEIVNLTNRAEAAEKEASRATVAAQRIREFFLA